MNARSQLAEPEAPASASSALAAMQALQVTASGELGGAAAHWVLRANCSLTPVALCSVFASMVSVSALIGLAFWSLGAPWVLPFAGMEMLGLGLALWVYARRVEDGEELWLQGDTLHMRARRGRASRVWAFPAAWVTVRCGGATGDLIELACSGQRVRAGARLPAHRRAQIAISIRQSVRAVGFVGLELN